MQVKKKSKKVSLEFSKRELRKLFDMVMLHEVLEELISDKPSSKVSSICEKLKPYYSEKQIEQSLHRAYRLLDEYIEWEDMQEFDELVEHEREAVVKVLQEVEKQGLNFGSDDIFQRLNQELNQDGVVRLVNEKKKYND